MLKIFLCPPLKTFSDRLLAKKYLGKDQYPFRQPGEVRVMYKIRPDRVTQMG